MMEEKQPGAAAVIAAEVDSPAEAKSEALLDTQLAELDRRLREMEAAIADLRTKTSAEETGEGAAPAGTGSVAASAAPGRKTLPTHTAQLLAKQGVQLHAGRESMDVSSVDAALVSLSVEQRIAVKSQMLRAGLLG